MAKYEDYADPKENSPKEEPKVTTDELVREEAGEPQTQTQDTKDSEEDVPEKYRGKTLSEVVRMHQEAEQAVGRQGNELGELRKTVDQLVEQNLQQTAPREEYKPAPVEEIDYFTDPEKAVQQAVSNNPDVKQARELAAQITQQQAQAELQRRHPDLERVIQDSDFQEWIKANPYRQKQLLEADKNFDVEAGDDLLTTFKTIKEVKKPAPTQSAPPPSTREVDTGTVRNAGQKKQGGKVIFRSDIRELQRTNPRRYKEMLPEIRKAYSQGRIRD